MDTYITNIQHALFLQQQLKRDLFDSLFVELKKRIKIDFPDQEIKIDIPQMNFGNMFFMLSWAKYSLQISPNRVDLFYIEKRPFENKQWYGEIFPPIANLLGGIFSFFNESVGINRLGAVLNGVIPIAELNDPTEVLNREILGTILKSEKLGIRRLEMNNRFQLQEITANDNRFFWTGMFSSEGNDRKSIGFLRDINTLPLDKKLTVEQYQNFLNQVEKLFYKEQVLIVGVR